MCIHARTAATLPVYPCMDVFGEWRLVYVLGALWTAVMHVVLCCLRGRGAWYMRVGSVAAWGDARLNNVAVVRGLDVACISMHIVSGLDVACISIDVVGEWRLVYVLGALRLGVTHVCILSGHLRVMNAWGRNGHRQDIEVYSISICAQCLHPRV